MLKFPLILAGAIAAPVLAHANCISDAATKFEAFAAREVFSEFMDERGNEVVIYKLKNSDQLLVVEGTANCVTAMKTMGKDELSERYGIEDESECEECAGIAEGGEDLRQTADMGEAAAENVEGMTQYDNINVAALLELYEAYEGILACYKARENQFSVYLTKGEMRQADVALKKDEAEILRRDPRINKGAVAALAKEGNKLFAAVVLTSGLREVNYEHRNACRQLFQIFPPGIDKAQLVEREVIGKDNTGGGLIVPVDPRFQ
ncbi:hypothetical protein [Shinella sp. M31]|uniref:hypothetical protein n=1 Tax=Shinella sp. M31 TaxID=3368615 RepID=UPI003BA225A9